LVIPKSSIESVLGYNKSLGNALLNKYEANLLDSYVNDSKKKLHGVQVLIVVMRLK